MWWIQYSVLFQTDSSSTQYQVTVDNDVEADEEQELLIPDSRGKGKKSPESSRATYQEKK